VIINLALAHHAQVRLPPNGRHCQRRAAERTLVFQAPRNHKEIPLRHGIPILFIAALATTAVALHTVPTIHAEDREVFRLEQQEPSAPPTLKVYSRETVVDVTVTDSHGNPVHGLTQADFTVKEDGKLKPIRSFE
jgi:hypothetical protein